MANTKVLGRMGREVKRKVKQRLKESYGANECPGYETSEIRLVLDSVRALSTSPITEMNLSKMWLTFSSEESTLRRRMNVRTEYVHETSCSLKLE